MQCKSSAETLITLFFNIKIFTYFCGLKAAQEAAAALKMSVYSNKKLLTNISMYCSYTMDISFGILSNIKNFTVFVRFDLIRNCRMSF